MEKGRPFYLVTPEANLHTSQIEPLKDAELPSTTTLSLSQNAMQNYTNILTYQKKMCLSN